MKAQDLKKSILQYAMQGKLVPQNPQDEPASELLKRIKAEKEQLIKEGKIKKEKPLPPITQDEIPYDLPQGWQWVRLGNVGLSNIGLTYKPADITQSEISNYLNISQVAYSYYELGKRSIPLELLCKLADYYNTSVDYLLYRTNQKKPYKKT